ncbi:MAG: hypothetical protein JRE70_04815 [Deltaproteobacteria bacterium]|nr:hypothetical protein [Deltaproteobacteria bacterium]
MQLRSRGLGRKALVMDFREYEVVREGNEIVVVGTIRDPVHWDFSIRICEDDLAGIARIALRKPTLGFVFRSLFKRIKDAHWTQERSEHLAEGARRRVQAKEKGEQRVQQAEAARKEAAAGAGARDRADAKSDARGAVA